MIIIKNLKKSFGEQEVLKGVNLEIKEGKITFIIGKSGGGKSVLLKHILGLLKPDDGEVFIDGVDITKVSLKELNEVRKKFGVLFQNVALFDSMNVFDNVAFPLVEHTKLSKKEIREKVEKTLEMVGLRGIEKKMPSELSGGMKKRVGLARAIILNPKILIFDEPTTGLDPIICDAVDNMIVDIQKKLNLTVLVVSHDIPAVFKIADFVAMLDNGIIVEYGTPDDLKKSNNETVKEFLKRDLFLEN